MIYTPEQVFAKDLSNLHLLVNWASDMQRCGSYSQRRPDLGKCRTCPYCHRRRYENGPRCCNPAYAKTKRAWSEEEGFHQVECEERIHQQPISKPIIKRFLHKRHGQSRHWKVRSLTLIFQNNEEALRNAVNENQDTRACAHSVFYRALLGMETEENCSRGTQARASGEETCKTKLMQWRKLN